MSNDTLARADEFVAAGQHQQAITVLRDALASERNLDLESRLLSIRHSAFDAMTHPAGPAEWPASIPDSFGGTGLPEVSAEDLSADLIAAALANRGALIVRGLVDPTRAASLRSVIDRAFEGAARLREDPSSDTRPDLVPFEPDERHPFGPYERAFANFGSGVLGVDSPSAMYEMTEALEAAGMRGIMTDYFHEPPAFSVKKTTLRRTAPGSLAGWHQDGAFLGTDTRALNVWTALSPCGADAPGLDVFAHRFDHLVPTGGDKIYDWSVSDDTASTYDASQIERPIFDTGDALLFDHMTLHRTGVDPSMTATRYAIEMWFFAPSTYPTEQIPILF
ncbi:MAG: hypothetical protein ACI9C1_000572 [Candidatus Aldehydirespiratoraceae bacterium]|jgi:hypothetical protein